MFTDDESLSLVVWSVDNTLKCNVPTFVFVLHPLQRSVQLSVPYPAIQSTHVNPSQRKLYNSVAVFHPFLNVPQQEPNPISFTSSLRTAPTALVLLVLTPWWNLSANVAHFSKCFSLSFSFVRKVEQVCQKNTVVMSSKTVNVSTRYCAAHNKSNIQYTGPVGFPTTASLFSVPICTSSNEFAYLEVTHWTWN